MRRHHDETPDFDPSDPPYEPGFFKYIVGLLGPPAILLLTGLILWHGRVPVRRGYGWGDSTWQFEGGMRMVGLNAWALGWVGVALAVFVHVSFFWGPKVGQTFWTDLLRIVTLLMMISGMILLIVRIMVLNRL